jgi:hypothetical protein
MNPFKEIKYPDQIFPGCHREVLGVFTANEARVRELLFDRIEAMRVVRVFYQNESTKDAAFKLLEKLLEIDQKHSLRPARMLAPDFNDALKALPLSRFHKQQLEGNYDLNQHSVVSTQNAPEMSP